MPTFRYKLTDTEGNSEEATIEAPDRFAVYKQVRKEGKTIVSVVEEGSGGSAKRFFDLAYLNSLVGRVKIDEVVMLTRNLAAMIEAGLVLSRALNVMERQTKNAKLKMILADIETHVKKGEPFSDSLEKYPKVFSPLFIAMARAGEESGSLSDSLHVVGEQMDKSYLLKKKIKGAMIYPAIILIAMVVIAILMMIYIVPTLSQTFKELGAELPATTQSVIAVSDFMVAHTFATIGLLVGVVLLFIWGLRTKRGSRMFEWFILHIPIIGTLVREVNSARTARTFSSLLSSGVEILEALSITKDVVQNSYFKDVIGMAEAEIQTGAPISKVFIEHDHLYPVLFGEIVSVGEETGKLSDMLSQVALFYEREVDQKTKDMSTIIEPFLMIFIGTGVGFFALSMISPIYSLSSSI